jgi:hypothetical protein
MRRHERIPPLTVELAPVYRWGTEGRRYLSSRYAYIRAAITAYWTAYGDGDEEPPYYHPPDDKPGGCDHFKRVTGRLARWLRWRDGRRAAIARAAGT